jgi:hypothetical protein
LYAGWTNAETVSEIQDVCKLSRRRNVKNTDVAKRHLLPDKVNVDLDMLGAAMLNWVRSHVDCTDSVTKDNGCSMKGMMKLLE